jgi:hypothetical protein
LRKESPQGGALSWSASPGVKVPLLPLIPTTKHLRQTTKTSKQKPYRTLLARALAFEKFCGGIELPNLEQKTVADVKLQLAASFGDGDITLSLDIS